MFHITDLLVLLPRLFNGEYLASYLGLRYTSCARAVISNQHTEHEPMTAALPLDHIIPTALEVYVHMDLKGAD